VLVKQCQIVNVVKASMYLIQKIHGGYARKHKRDGGTIFTKIGRRALGILS